MMAVHAREMVVKPESLHQDMAEYAEFALHCTMIIFSAIIDAVRLPDIGDQL